MVELPVCCNTISSCDFTHKGVAITEMNSNKKLNCDLMFLNVIILYSWIAM